jgi:hypothetical protein
MNRLLGYIAQALLGSGAKSFRIGNGLPEAISAPPMKAGSKTIPCPAEASAPTARRCSPSPTLTLAALRGCRHVRTSTAAALLCDQGIGL